MNTSNDGHWASARAVRVVQLLSMGDTTERLRVHLVYCQCPTVVAVSLIYVPYPCMSTGFPIKINATLKINSTVDFTSLRMSVRKEDKSFISQTS